jgi:hypothetical protein
VEKILTGPAGPQMYSMLKSQPVESFAEFTGTDPLEELNSRAHSLGYLFILYDSLDAVPLDAQKLTLLLEMHELHSLRQLTRPNTLWSEVHSFFKTSIDRK